MPPHTIDSADGADVAAPVSLMEWFLNYYDAARRGEDSSDSDDDDNGGSEGEEGGAAGGGSAKPRLRSGVVPPRTRRGGGGVRPLECIVRAGELLFVPRGWFHMVVNLDESVAVTHNFVSERNLDAVLSFLRTGTGVQGLVSGCEQRNSLLRRFVAALKRHRPEVWAAHEAREAARHERAEREGRLGRIFKEAAAGVQGQQQCKESGALSSSGGDDAKRQAEDSRGHAAAPAAGGFTFGFSL